MTSSALDQTRVSRKRQWYRCVLLLALVLGGGAVEVGAQRVLFAEPFLIEHHLIHQDLDGSELVTEPVVDQYFGSWIVSQRPNGSRLVIDLQRRELTEILPESGTYTVLGFGRFGELQRRVQELDGLVSGEEEKGESDGEDGEPSFVIEEVPVHAGTEKRAGSELLDRDGVKRLRVRLSGDESDKAASLAVDVWFDPELRLSQAGMAALQSFEQALASNGEKQAKVPYSAYVAAAREQMGGAVPIRVVRPMTEHGDGTVEDLALRIETLALAPLDLVAVPDGYRRTPHPLEQLVAYLEEQEALAGKALQGESR